MGGGAESFVYLILYDHLQYPPRWEREGISSFSSLSLHILLLDRQRARGLGYLSRRKGIVDFFFFFRKITTIQVSAAPFQFLPLRPLFLSHPCCRQPSNPQTCRYSAHLHPVPSSSPHRARARERALHALLPTARARHLPQAVLSPTRGGVDPAHAAKTG